MTTFSEIPDTSLVLVAIIPNKRDLDIARALGWYRIPLKSAPKVISVDYLAFYQTAAFDKADRWQIRWIAPILGHELTTRADLFRNEAEHPRANEEYFKLQLGSLIEIPNPIQAGDWKRVTFFYTTGQRCKHAKVLTDLPVRDEERQILWRSLRERALRGQEYNAQELPEMAIDPSILAFLGGLAK